MAKGWGKNGNSGRFYFVSKITMYGDPAMKLKDTCSLKEKL